MKSTILAINGVLSSTTLVGSVLVNLSKLLQSRTVFWRLSGDQLALKKPSVSSCGQCGKYAKSPCSTICFPCKFSSGTTQSRATSTSFSFLEKTGSKTVMESVLKAVLSSNSKLSWWRAIWQEDILPSPRQSMFSYVFGREMSFSISFFK